MRTVPVAAVAVASLLTVQAASAQSCGEVVAALRDSIDSTDTEAVVRPPAVETPGVIEPPAIGSDMPTAPAVPEHTARGPTAPAEEPSAARTTQIEALLTAARAAADRGDEAECLARLAEAEQLATAEDVGE